MKVPVIFAAIAVTLTSACADIAGQVGRETRLDRQGTLDCTASGITSADLVQGTSLDPARCGPQQQPVSP